MVTKLLTLFHQVLVVAKQPDMLGVAENDRVRLLRENSPSQATLVGLCTGLRHADRMLNYIVGCDMPGIVPTVIRTLYGIARTHDAALRCDAEGALQPLGGFYTKRALPLLERNLAAGNFRLRGILPELQIASLTFDRLRSIDEGLRSFWNINTPGDLGHLLGKLDELVIE